MTTSSPVGPGWRPFDALMSFLDVGRMSLNDIGCRVQGSTTMAWPNTGAKSCLTGRGLSCRLAWQTVCKDQAKFGWFHCSSADRATGKHAGTNIEEAELESWVLRVYPLVYFQLSTSAVFADKFHFTDLSGPGRWLPSHPSVVHFVHKRLDHLSS